MDLDAILKSEKPVLIDFWAEWCGPCRMMNPLIEKIKKDYDNIDVIKVNVDENKNLSAQFQIRSIPTLVLLKEGKQVWRNSGVLNEETLKSRLKTIL